MKSIKFIAAVVACLMISFGAYAFDAVESIVSIGGGVGVSNSISDQKSHAWNLEQEVRYSSGQVWQYGYLNEGHKADGEKRDGIYGLYKLSYSLTPHLATSVAFGPYFNATTVSDETTTITDGQQTTTNVGAYHDSYRLSLLGSVSVRYYVTPLWDIEGQWDHPTWTKADSDVFLVRVGRSFR